MEKFLTVPQVAELFQVSPSLVYKWVHYDFIPHIKLGTLVRFKRCKVEKWAEKRESKGRTTYKVSI